MMSGYGLTGKTPHCILKNCFRHSRAVLPSACHGKTPVRGDHNLLHLETHCLDWRLSHQFKEALARPHRAPRAEKSLLKNSFVPGVHNKHWELLTAMSVYFPVQQPSSSSEVGRRRFKNTPANTTGEKSFVVMLIRPLLPTSKISPMTDCNTSNNVFFFNFKNNKIKRIIYHVSNNPNMLK